MYILLRAHSRSSCRRARHCCGPAMRGRFIAVDSERQIHCCRPSARFICVVLLGELCCPQSLSLLSFTWFSRTLSLPLSPCSLTLLPLTLLSGSVVRVRSATFPSLQSPIKCRVPSLPAAQSSRSQFQVSPEAAVRGRAVRAHNARGNVIVHGVRM